MTRGGIPFATTHHGEGQNTARRDMHDGLDSIIRDYPGCLDPAAEHGGERRKGRGK